MKLHWFCTLNLVEVTLLANTNPLNKQNVGQKSNVFLYQHRESTSSPLLLKENMKSSSCFWLGVDFLGNYCEHHIFVAPAHDHVQGTVLFNDVTDITGWAYGLPIDAYNHIVVLQATTENTKQQCVITIAVLFLGRKKKISGLLLLLFPTQQRLCRHGSHEESNQGLYLWSSEGYNEVQKSQDLLDVQVWWIPYFTAFKGIAVANSS